MAQSHHRKAHKQRLKDYKHVNDDLSHVKQKTGTGFVFTILGAVLGAVVGYISTNNALWAAAGAVVLGAVGYLLGKRVEQAR